jgi:hypothetical protein
MSSDKEGADHKGSLMPSLGKLVAKVSGGGLAAEPSASADRGSVALAGDNYGAIVNVNVGTLTLAQERQVARELPSYLSGVVARFSEDLSGYGEDPRRTLPPEIEDKLTYNNFPPRHPIVSDYVRFAGVLESTYRGIEQRNDDARRMVRRKARLAYELALIGLCSEAGVDHAVAHDFARSNAVRLVQAVIDSLMTDLRTSDLAGPVMQETAHLAVSLIVADAVIECEVLERPANAAAA